MAIRAWGRRLLPQSLQRQLTLALLLLFLFGAGTTLFTLHELDLRKHDYVILNLSGQLRAISQTLVQQSLRFSNQRQRLDESAYLAEVAAEAERYQRIVTSLKNRVLEPELTGRSDPLVCSWDAQSISQLTLAAESWAVFREGMAAKRGGGAKAVAGYVLENSHWIGVVSTNLTTSFQRMMEEKMALIVLLNTILLGLTVVTVVVLLLLLRTTFMRPL